MLTAGPMNPTAPPANPIGRVAHRVATSEVFNRTVLGVIGANALIMAIETYGHGYGTLNTAFWLFYCAELLIRLVAFGAHPARFFTNGWNIFDFVIVVAVALPFIQGHIAAVRILRLLRVVRVLSLIPDLRIIIRGLVRSVAPMLGVTFLTLIILFLYAMVGTTMLGERLPERWGDVGVAMLTMLEVLTLDSWGLILGEARAVTPWAVPFMVSFVLIGGFVVLNIVIAVVINSVEEARRLELAGGRAGYDTAPTPDTDTDAGADGAAPASRDEIRELLRAALAALDADAARAHPPAAPTANPSTSHGSPALRPGEAAPEPT